MSFLLSGLNSIVLFLTILIASSTYTCLGLYIVYKKFGSEKASWHGQKFITSFFTIIGALLGLVLAMVLVSVWQNYQKEKENINSEVSTFTNIYMDAGALDTIDCLHVREQLKKINNVIINDAWPKMEKGEVSINTEIQMGLLYKYLGNLDSKDKLRHTIIIEKMMKSLDKAYEIRRTRRLNISQGMIPPLMWKVILICALISISSGFFFYIRPRWLHVILSLFHSTMVSIIIFLILSLIYPYRGGSKIDSEPYQYLLKAVFPTIDREYKRGNN